MLGVMASRTERGMMSTVYRRWNMFAAVQAERSRHRASAQVAAYHFAVRTTSAARMRLAFATWTRFLQARRCIASKIAALRAIRFVSNVRLALRSFLDWRCFCMLRALSTGDVLQRLLHMKRECRHRLCGRYLCRWMEFAWMRGRKKCDSMHVELVSLQSENVSLEQQCVAWRGSADRLIHALGPLGQLQGGRGMMHEVLLPHQFAAKCLSVWHDQWCSAKERLQQQLVALRGSEAELRKVAVTASATMRQNIITLGGYIAAVLQELRVDHVASLEELRSDYLSRIRDLEADNQGKDQLALMCEDLMGEIATMRRTHQSLTQRIHDRDEELDHARVQLLSTRAELERVCAEFHSEYRAAAPYYYPPSSSSDVGGVSRMWHTDSLCRVVARLMQAISCLEDEAFECSGNVMRVDPDAVSTFLRVVRREFRELTTLSRAVTPRKKVDPGPPPPASPQQEPNNMGTSTLTASSLNSDVESLY